MDIERHRIAVIGLGYVGLPLALAFGAKRPVLGFDIDERRISDLRGGRDITLEASAQDFAEARFLDFSCDPDALRACQIFIVTVPTPIDRANRPDLTPLRRASEAVGAALAPGSIVIYEPTVYPGCTEGVCAPILERISGLKLNVDFFLGYSPERVNPGDRARRLQTIVKVTSGSTPAAAQAIDALYASIVTAGTYRASSIAVAEAAKAIENTQRDLNVALMNELSLMFSRLGIDTAEVLEAAATKWNFLNFTPGLVGGHCIGVDPYYLTHRAQEVGYHPEIILAGRRINDAMGYHVAEQTTQLMMCKGIPVVGSRVLIMGATFKENTPDLRNSRVADIVERLRGYNAQVEIWDPWADPATCEQEIGVRSIRAAPQGPFDGIVVAVAHDQFHEFGADGLSALRAARSIVFDVKGVFDRSLTDGRL